MICSNARRIAACLFVFAAPLHAQHEGHNMPGEKVPTAGPLGIPMERMGSGTTWIPDAVTLPSRHVTAGRWMLMLHGWVFLQQDWQGSERGASQFGSLNWAMVMADRPIGSGKLQLRFMPSLDPATVGKCGYPLLLQSGETCDGQSLVDRQHPHDFLMELGALLEQPVSSNVALLLYAAPAGEPALGPVAFMHRPSAMDEPQAPLGHHWQDATHISFGVVTAGVFTRRMRLEVSSFNAHEPDESRWNFDRVELNSLSGRLTLNPTDNWSMTAGFGVLSNPERHVPSEDVRRLVLSMLHGRRLAQGQWSTAVVYGMNKHEGSDASHSALVETERVSGRTTLFGRLEWVQKSAHDLDVATGPGDQVFGVTAASAGFVRDVLGVGAGILGLGARGSVYLLPDALEPVYGGKMSIGGMVFARLRLSGK